VGPQVMVEARNLHGRTRGDRRRYRTEPEGPAPSGKDRSLPTTAQASGIRVVGDSQALKLHVLDSIDEAQTIWRSFERRAVASPFQTYGWLSNWYANVGHPTGVSPVIVFGYDQSERLVLLMPLGVGQAKGPRTLAWLGDGLAGYNAPLVDPALLQSFSPQAVDAIWQRIIDHVGSIDILRLRRQPRMLGQFHNPFVHGARVSGAGGGRLLVLPSTWTEFAAEHIGEGRRTGADCGRYLRQRGRLTIGLSLPVQARSRVVEKILAVARSQTGKQSRRNPLQQAGVGAFFKAMALSESTGFLNVSAVNVDDEMIAGSIGYVHGNRYYLAVTSIEASDDGVAAERLLCEELIRSCIVQGIKSIDFLGGTPAVPQWTGRPAPLYEAISGCSLTGQAVVGLKWAGRALGLSTSEHDAFGGGVRQTFKA
jgi:CelD/BcsL family acetyltransferase involved in cellulose biosynthesis